MILTTDQIKEIVIKNPNKALVDKAKTDSKKLRMHIYGENLKTEITSIKGHESNILNDLRKRYAKSNKDLFARWFRPIDKVFSARGGSVYYNLTDTGNKKAMALSNDVVDGLSARKWIETKWKPHSLDDPGGIIFMEIGAPKDGEVTPYPTYKSITVIHDYLPAGINLEYISFNVSSADKEKAGYKPEDIIYRIVDDAYDYWVKRDGEEVQVIKEHTLPNFFGKVPAVMNSDIMSTEVPGLMLSIASDVIELADDFIQTGSIRNLAKLRMAYPKYWEYADDCTVCHGEKSFEGKRCETCKGSGKKIMLEPGDSKLLVYPDDKVPVITPNVAGFVEFPKSYFDYATSELHMLENIGHVTLWGAGTKIKTNGPSGTTDTGAPETATQVLLELQPETDRLKTISEMAEKRHKFIVDHILQITIDSSYKGASINYGRRYLLEGPDEIWLKYSDARTKGAGISILDDLLMEYIETKYSGDAVSMSIQVKLLNIEPFVHFTISQVQGFNTSVEDYNKKLYFSEWLATLNEAMLLSFSEDELKEQLNDYISKKNLKEPVEVDPVLN